MVNIKTMEKLLLTVILVTMNLFSSGCRQKIEWNNDLNKTEADMSGYHYLQDDHPAFEQITLEESFRLFENNQSGVVLYSRTSCDFCNAAVPILNEAAKDCNVKILYVDIDDPAFISLPLSDQKELVDHLTELVSSVLENNNLLIPLVVGVKNGKITGSYVGLTDSIKIKEYKDNDKAALNGMKRIYTTIIHSVLK